jgi:hypothetical protein
MFWTIVAPFFTTCALAVVAIVAATTLAPRWRARREWACLATTALAIVLFVPSCLAIELGMNTLRFGVFRYESGRDIGDWRVERYMPGAAREITLMKYPAGFDAEFHIARADLEGWLDEQWALHRASADANFHGAAPPVRGEPRPIEPDMIHLHLPGRPDGGMVPPPSPPDPNLHEATQERCTNGVDDATPSSVATLTRQLVVPSAVAKVGLPDMIPVYSLIVRPAGASSSA